MAAAQLLGGLFQAAGAAFSHPAIKEFRDRGPDSLEEPAFFSLFDLVRLFEHLERQARLLAHARAEPPLEWAPEQTTTAEMIAWLEEHLARHPTGEWLDASALLATQATAERCNTLFLALLEAARNAVLVLRQDEVFGAIWCQPAR